MSTRSDVSRRHFLASSCYAWIAALASASPAKARQLWRPQQQNKVVVQEAWGRIEQISEGVWALISTPLQDRKTLSNGAIIAGKNRVVVVEAFGSVDGARWLADWARKLTGRPVDDMIVTHYHGDHTGGIAAYAKEGERKAARLRTTETTAALIREDDTKRNRPAEQGRTELLSAVVHFDPEAPTAIDLGDRTISIIPRTGHTRSDVTIELDDPRIVIAGDLLWNRMFPNYVDAKPTALSRSVWALGYNRAQAYVPGHGPLASHADYERYVEVLNLVEAAARKSHQSGTPAADAAKDFKLPESLGEWTLFSPRYFEVAIAAWLADLRSADQGSGIKDQGSRLTDSESRMGA
jgi:glyoxylase-like metal-dependent hydrolase (beta-lactamase superfamily II)